MLLVIETSTAACSVALFDDGMRLMAQTHELVGRGHAERLIPMIAELPGGGRSDHVLVGCGPGSFTGIRVGIAAAQGLALGWKARINGYCALDLLAWRAFEIDPALDMLTIANEAGHGEFFVQQFQAAPFAAKGPLESLDLAAAQARIGETAVIGTGCTRLARPQAFDVEPTAADAIRLPEPLRSLPPAPIYGRAPDAKLPA